MAGYPTLGSVALHPAVAAAATHPVVAPILTLAQQLSQASQLPAVQAIRDAQAQADAAAKQNQQTVAGYYAALAPIMQHIAPAVGQGYQQAAGMDALLGKGFGNELGQQQAANQTQAQGILGLAGAPAGQQANVNQMIGGQGTQNALGWLNGGLPATGLEQAGAAAQAAASSLPASVAGQGGQQLASLLARQQAADQGFAQKRTDLAAQLPGLILKNENTLANQAATNAYHNAEANAATENAATGRLRANTAATEAQAMTQYRQTMAGIAEQRAQSYQQAVKVDAAYKNGELSAKQYEDKISALKAQTAQYSAQERAAVAQFNAQTSRMNAQTSRIRASKTSPKIVGDDKTGRFIANGDGSFTPLPGVLGKPVTSTKAGSASTDRLLTNHIEGMLKGTATRYVHSPTDPNAVNGFVPVPGTGPSTAASYQDAIGYAMAAGKTKPQATALVNQLVPMGQNGRPYVGKAAVNEVITATKQLFATPGAFTSADAAARQLKSSGLLPGLSLSRVRAIITAQIPKVNVGPNVFGNG